MQTAAVSELKASLSQFLARVKAGEKVLVAERGRPVACLMPVAPCTEKMPAHLLEMQRRGLVRIGTAELPEEFWTLPRPKDETSATLQALLAERENGR